MSPVAAGRGTSINATGTSWLPSFRDDWIALPALDPKQVFGGRVFLADTETGAGAMAERRR